VNKQAALGISATGGGAEEYKGWLWMTATGAMGLTSNTGNAGLWICDGSTVGTGSIKILLNTTQASFYNTPITADRISYNLYDAGNKTGAFALNCSNGGVQKLTLTGDGTFNLPTNGVEGNGLEVWVKASGADRVLTLNASIQLPSYTGVTSPITITSGKTNHMKFHYFGSTWVLSSNVGEFTI
jgi:hypothetical protein